MDDPVVICGFGPPAQLLANMLESPLAASGPQQLRYIAFDLDPARVTVRCYHPACASRQSLPPDVCSERSSGVTASNLPTLQLCIECGLALALLRMSCQEMNGPSS